MIVDAHQHFWRLDRGDYSWLTPHLGILYRDYGPDDLRPILAGNDVAWTVLVQAAASEDETRYLIDLSRRNSFIAGVVGWVDFESSDSLVRIRALVDESEGRIKGLRPMVQDISDPAWLARPTLDKAFDSVIDHSLTFDALVKPRHLRVLGERLKRHPQLRAVLDHAGKPRISNGEFQPWADDIAELASNTRLYCKLSGLLTEAGERRTPEALAPYVAHLFDCFGPHRVMWGSDWPVLGLSATYDEWHAMACEIVGLHAPEAMQAVFADNAISFYGLNTGRSGEWP